MAYARETWWTNPDGVGGISPERLVFLDECGVLTNLVPLYGRSPRGTCTCASAPFGHWTRLTVLGALGHEGVIAAMSVEAATSAAVFHAYLDRVLLPELRRSRPEAVLVMDNLPAHKAPCVRALLDASGFSYRGPWPRAGRAGPGAARLLARPQPDRADLGQGEGWATSPRRPDRRGAAPGTRPGPRRRHPAGGSRMLPPLRLWPSQITRNPH